MHTSNSQLTEKIDSAIVRSLAQLEIGVNNGKITQTEVSSNQSMTDSKYISSVYIPSYIAHSVSFLKDITKKSKIVLKLQNFLEENREEPGIWRFHGKYQKFPPPDFDDTCCVIASLKKNEIDVKTDIWKLLSKYRSDSGLYYTWIDDELNKKSFNHTDGGVNINILYCASLFGQKIREIIEYITLHASVNEFYRFSIYSVSDYSVIYLMSRAFRDGKITELRSAMVYAINFLKEAQHDDGSWGNDLDSAFGLTALVNSSYEGPETQKGLDYLLKRQQDLGKLNSCAFFKAFTPAYYGSSYLTNAIFLESLLKLKYR